MRTISLVFACYDRACRPPTSGGTGGSLKRGVKASRIDKFLDSRGHKDRQVPVTLGRRVKPDRSERTPPTGYGAEGWAKDKATGMWKTSGPLKKYAIKGKESGEWIVAHAIGTRDNLRPAEIKRSLERLDKLQAEFPLRVRPELVVGNFAAQQLRGIDSGTGGFTIKSQSLHARNGFFMSMFSGSDFPVGPHVVYVNTPKIQLAEFRREYNGREVMARNTVMMPSYNKPDTDRLEYVVAHEYGHLRMHQKIDNEEAWKPVVRAMLDKGMMPPGAYARSSGSEAHAESFAEWVMSRGQTDDMWTRGAAEAMGWPTPKK